MRRLARSRAAPNGTDGPARSWLALLDENRWVALCALAVLACGVVAVVLSLRLLTSGALKEPPPRVQRSMRFALLAPEECTECVKYSTSDGRKMIAGTFTEPADMDPGEAEHPYTPIGGADIVLAVFDSLDALRWVRTIGSTGADRCAMMYPDDSTIYIAGQFNGPVQLADGGRAWTIYTGALPDRLCVLRFDLTGALCWAKSAQEVLADSSLRRVQGRMHLR